MFPHDPQHQTFVNIYEGDDADSQMILDGSHPQLEYIQPAPDGSVLAVVKKFVPSGIHHILIGPDHTCFWSACCCSAAPSASSLMVVTSFTVAHSITLSLAALNIVTPPARLIEPAIALSIVYVGADNLLKRRPRRPRLDRVRVRLHPRLRLRQRPARDGPAGARARLVAVLVQRRRRDRAAAWSSSLVASALRCRLRRRVAAGRHLALAGSVVVIAAGAFWFVQRVFFPGGIS